eukprot:TRINITY_DN26469_c0_g1_i1.p1 TRINITY_DN26469_c0_g1~~TRINITY_DN26469_c0_g1_i1.p1  ORF type:complete len:239 (+),score=52.06 TRINITY_DN26469_c0_g1_i1:48-719(+)
MPGSSAFDSLVASHVASGSSRQPAAAALAVPLRGLLAAPAPAPPAMSARPSLHAAEPTSALGAMGMAAGAGVAAGAATYTLCIGNCNKQNGKSFFNQFKLSNLTKNPFEKTKFEGTELERVEKIYMYACKANCKMDAMLLAAAASAAAGAAGMMMKKSVLDEWSVVPFVGMPGQGSGGPAACLRPTRDRTQKASRDSIGYQGSRPPRTARQADMVQFLSLADS